MNSKILFLVAFIAVFGGLFGIASNYLASPSSTPTTIKQPERKKPTVTYTVWRAKQTLDKGQAITPNQLTRELVSEQQAHDLGINNNISLDFAATTLLNTTIQRGALVMPENQSTPNQAGYLSLITHDGMTLYPLTVNSNNLIAHYIQPGDFIDIMAISSPNTNLSNATTQISDFNKVQASLFMKHVRVLSIGNASDDQVNPEVNNTQGMLTTVVIEVTPDDLAKLSLAQRTMYLEIYRSQHYRHTPDVQINDVIHNYSGVTELRGSGSASTTSTSVGMM